jgi:uncharacterized protein (TIGR03437 family)
MKLGILPVFVLAMVQASATVATLGVSNQNFNMTGIGPDASGAGQAKVSWGTCAYDGTNTNCTLSGAFTGYAGGGNYSFVLSYPGNGPFPLIAVFPAGSNLFHFQLAVNVNTSLVITLTPTNGPAVSFYSFANFSFFYTPSATCTGIGTCSAAQVAQTANATIVGPITGSFDPTPTISPNGVITASNYGSYQAAAPSSWIEIYGFNLATTLLRVWQGSDFNGLTAPTAIGGTSVTIGGKNAYVYFASPGQVDVQVPSGLTAGPQPLVVTTAGGSSAAYGLTINVTEPGLLSPQAFLIKGSQYATALLNGTLTYVLPVAVPGLSTARAKVGDTITLYGIGFGLLTPDLPAGQIAQATDVLQNSFTVTIGGLPATVTYDGIAPSFVGLYQFNVTVPNVAASDTVPLTFTLGGIPGTQKLVIPVQ